MTTQQISRTEACRHEPSPTGEDEHAATRGARRRGARARVASAALVLGVAASLAVGGWGVFSSLGAGVAPARVGEAVEVPGGLVRVDRVAPEHMAQMQADKFAASGMNMSSMGMDMAPEGQRRFTVDVALAAEGGDLGFFAEEFRITGKDMKETGPIRDGLEGKTVPAGGVVSGSLVFQVPEKASGIELSFDGGRPVALNLPAAKAGEGHGHGVPAKDQEDGGPHEGEHDH